jgi:hypothetical protein
MINNSMKSFKEYLAEAVQENPIRIKIACDVTDDMMDIIERELERYDMVSINKPVKTIMQEHPLDFGTKIRNAEVYIIDAIVNMPLSHETFRRNLSDKLAIAYETVVVKGPNDPIEIEQEAEVQRQTADSESYEPKVGQDYTDEEKKVAETDKPVSGEEHKKNFLKDLQDFKENDPDRGKVEVEGPLSQKATTDAKDNSQPKEDDSKTKSPLTQDNRKPL